MQVCVEACFDHLKGEFSVIGVSLDVFKSIWRHLYCGLAPLFINLQLLRRLEHIQDITRRDID